MLSPHTNALLLYLCSTDGEDDGPAAKRIKTEEEHDNANDDEVAAIHAAAATAAAEQQAYVDAATAASQMDPSAMMGGLTAEQLANFQQAGMPVFTPEMLAALTNPGAQAIGPDGQPMMQMPMMTTEMAAQGFAGFDPASLGMAAMPGLQGMDMFSQMPPEQLQAIIQNPNLFMAGGFAMGGAGADVNSTYKNWWDEKDEVELMQMVKDPEYRREKLGTEELDWEKMVIIFNRTANALRKKFWSLSKAQGENPAAYGVTSPM